jgi:LPXTG-motif cell wall-anchored protein
LRKAAASLALAAALTLSAVPAMGMGTTTDGTATGTTTGTTTGTATTPTTPGAFGATYTDSNSMTNPVGTTDTNTYLTGNGTDTNRYNPYSNANRTDTTGYSVNNYRAYATNDDNMNWSWLGLLGLIGLAGLFGRNRERNDV